MGFNRRFRTPDGIVRRVPGVWVLPIPEYFNFCLFFLKIGNYGSHLGYQLMLMYRKGDLPDGPILTL